MGKQACVMLEFKFIFGGISCTANSSFGILRFTELLPLLPVEVINLSVCLGKRGSNLKSYHYNDVIMSAMASQITSLTIVYSTVYPGTDKRKHQSSASLAFVMGIHRWPVNSPHKGPVTRKIFSFDDVFVIHQYDAGCNDICDVHCSFCSTQPYHR